MLKEIGRVVAIEQDALWVQTIQKSTCGSCAAQKGCGQSLLSLLGVKPVYLRVLLEGRLACNYQVNDTIQLGIFDDIVVKSSLLAYLFPLISMLVFTLVAHTTVSNEITTILSAIVGGVLGGLLVRWHAKYYRNHSGYQPVIIDELTPEPLLLNQ